MASRRCRLERVVRTEILEFYYWFEFESNDESYSENDFERR